MKELFPESTFHLSIKFQGLIKKFRKAPARIQTSPSYRGEEPS